MVDAGAKQSLGMLDSSERAAQMNPQLIQFFVSTVGQVAFAMRPDLLHRVEFRCVAWEWIDMQPLVLTQKGFDIFTRVDLPPIPDQNHLSSQMPQQVLQEANDFRPGHVVAVETDVKSHSFAEGGDGEAGDDRKLLTPVAMPQEGGAAHRRPGSTDIGDEEKSALIEKGEMGPKCLGFFLFGARDISSIGRWPPRPAAGPVVPASGNSSPGRGVTASTPPRGCSEPCHASGSGGQSALRSTSRWNARLPRPPATTVALALLAARGKAGGDVPTAPGFEALAARSVDRPDTIGPPNSRTLSHVVLRRGMSSPHAAWRWLDVFGFLTAGEFHGVSCPR